MPWLSQLLSKAGCSELRQEGPHDIQGPPQPSWAAPGKQAAVTGSASQERRLPQHTAPWSGHHLWNPQPEIEPAHCCLLLCVLPNHRATKASVWVTQDFPKYCSELQGVMSLPILPPSTSQTLLEPPYFPAFSLKLFPALCCPPLPPMLLVLWALFRMYK